MHNNNFTNKVLSLSLLTAFVEKSAIEQETNGENAEDRYNTATRLKKVVEAALFGNKEQFEEDYAILNRDGLLDHLYNTYNLKISDE